MGLDALPPFLTIYSSTGLSAPPVQIHLMPGGHVRVFSRNCEDRTPSFPDVAEIVRAAAIGAPSCAIC